MLNLQTLPVNQAEFLNKLIESDGMALAIGRSEGATALQLWKKDWIEPFGRVDKKIRWKLKQHFNSEERKYLISLCDVSPNQMVGGTKEL